MNKTQDFKDNENCIIDKDNKIQLHNKDLNSNLFENKNHHNNEVVDILSKNKTLITSFDYNCKLNNKNKIDYSPNYKSPIKNEINSIYNSNSPYDVLDENVNKKNTNELILKHSPIKSTQHSHLKISILSDDLRTNKRNIGYSYRSSFEALDLEKEFNHKNIKDSFVENKV